MKTIIEIGETAWQGFTQPVLCRTEDGLEYFVKGNFAGRKALIAEWVSNRLGRLLSLPIPDFALLKLSPALALYSAKFDEVARLGRGTLFGSLRQPHLVEIRQTDVDLVDNHLKARVLAFDCWIANSDRILVDGTGNPNLLWSDAKQSLVVIDHNMAFEPSQMADFWEGHIFRAAAKLWSADFQMAMSHEFREALQQLPAIWQELPEEWTEIDSGLSFEVVRKMLWKFESEPDIFWHRL